MASWGQIDTGKQRCQPSNSLDIVSTNTHREEETSCKGNLPEGAASLARGAYCLVNPIVEITESDRISATYDLCLIYIGKHQSNSPWSCLEVSIEINLL